MRCRLRAEAQAEEHSVELDKSRLERALEEEVLREREVLDKAQGKLARMQAVRAGEATVHEAMARRNIRELKQTLEMEQVTSIC